MKKEKFCNTRDYQNSKINLKKCKKKQSYFKLFFSSFLISLTLILGIWVGFFLKNVINDKITIQSFFWERSIEIEKYQAVQESDWKLPNGARLISSQKEFYKYKKVIDHYEKKTRQVKKYRFAGYKDVFLDMHDSGNGEFEDIKKKMPFYEYYYDTETYNAPVYRQEALYKIKYYYEIDKWIYERSVRTSGTDKSPFWGKKNLASNERKSSKTESYYVIALDKQKKQKKISVSYEEWQSLEIGQTLKLKDGKIIIE